MEILLDNRNYVSSFNTSENTVFDDSIQIEEPEDFSHFESYFYCYKYINGELVFDENEYSKKVIKLKKEEIRIRREKECFALVDRSKFWYDSLTKEQYDELQEWYQNWLNATITFIIPKKPEWL